MLYSKYKVKVARQMKILSALIKYKWLIMGIATFCIVFTSIFLGVQGVITDDGSGMLVTEVTYGESVEYDAKALLSGVAYQYRKIGDTEWTDAKPDKVGEYEVRAVTTRSFGQKNYGKAFRFTINPQKTEVTLASATGVYGDKPSITANLAYSDKIVDFDFRYAEIADRKTTLSIDPASFVVQNAAGEDVSSQYEFSFADTKYALQQRKITFASGSKQFVYDETAHSSDEYEIPSGSLAFDDVATVSFDKTISSVGKEANSFEVTVTTAAGDDVTDLYAVTKNYGELRVIGKNIIITGKTDAEIIYDGKEHTDDGFTLDGNTPIVPSHEIRVKETTFATEAGEYTNEMTFEIVDAEGNDVTDCYDLNVTPGKFTIKPRPINVTTADKEFTYDGTAQFYEGCEADGLVEGHVLSVTSHTEITNVTKGKVANKLTVKVMNGETDVTANYYLPDENYTYGALTMLPRKITVKANGDTVTYDGAAHSSTEFTVAEPDGLIGGHEAAVIADTVKTLTTVGKTDNEFAVAIMANGESVTDNYEIAYDLGTLEVTKRKVKITTPTEEFVYDGAEHSSTDHANFVIGEGEDCYPLVDGHTIAPADISAVPAITNVFDGENGVANEFVIKIVDADGNDVTENYDTEDISFGTLKVTPRPVTVKADDDEKTYDGTPLENAGCTPGDSTAESGLVDGHELIAKAEGTITNAGTAENVVNEPAQIFATNGDDVTRNYDIKYDKGTLTVTPRDIIVTTDDGTFVYDGDEHYQPSCSADALVDALGHQLVATNYTTVMNVKDSGKANVLEVKVVDANGNDTVDGYYLSDNYNIIEWKNGTLTVLARTVRVTTGSDFKDYDGTPLTKHTFETQKGVEDEGLVEKHFHTMTLEFTGTITNVKFNEDGSIGTEENTVDRELTQIFDGSGESVIANYKIEYTLGTLEIDQRKIKIATPTEEFIYDGEPHSSVTNFDISVPEGYYDLVYGHTIAPDDTSAVPTITNVFDGVVRNAFAVQIYDENGEPVTKNYAIELSDGELTVTPRIVRVNVLGGKKVYDGTPLTKHEINVEQGIANEGLVSDHYISPRFTGSQTDAGQSVNTIDEENTKVLTLAGNIKDVTANYDVKYNYDEALLVVKQRPITITANSDEKDYDGDPLTNNGYTVSEYTTESGLIPGQILTAEVEGSQTVKGTSANVIMGVKITVKDENGNEKDVTANYEITSINGVLTVNPRAIKVRTRGDEFTYDGLDHAYNNDSDYEIVEGSLVKDHRFMLTEYTTVKNANGDGVKNVITLMVVRGEAGATEDMSENYAVTYDCGILKVNRRPIDITTASATFEYDGTAHTTEYSKNEITQDNPVTGHRIQVDSRTEITYVQQSGTLNKLVVSIWDGEGENATDNYDIHYDEGTLTVTPKAITVTTESHEFTYNGTDQFWEKCYTDGLVSADQFLEVIEHTTIRNVDDKSRENALVVIVTANGKDNVDGYYLTANYTISYSNGTLTVIPRPITIKTGDATKVYDGAPLTCNSYKDVAEDGDRGLVDGHKVTYVAVNGTRTEVGVSDNTVDLEKQPIIVDENGKEVTKNYEVSYAYGKLTVTKRPIKITTVSATKVYDGTPLDPTLYESYTVTSTANPALSPILAPDQSAEVDFLNTVTDVGSVKNKVAVRIYADADTEKATDLSANYEISYEYGTLSITPIQVRYTSESATKDFDGTPLTAPFDYDKTAFLAGHTPTVTFTSITFKGTINNELKSLEVVDAAGNVVPSNNYEFVPITGKVGTLTIVPIRITVQTGDAEKYYDGDPLSAEEYQVTSGNVLSGHEVLQPEFPSFTDVGRYANKIKLEIVDKTSKENMSDGYEITYEYGEIVIKARIIKIVSGGKTKVYDGKPLTCDAYYITGLEGIDEIPDEIELAVKNIGSQTEIGSSNNYVGESKVVFAGTDEVAPGYSIVVEDLGILTVKEKSDKDKTTGGGLDDSGDVSIRGDRNDGGDGGSDIIAFVVNGDTSGQLYLRYKSFGSYHGTGWNAATEYGGTLDGGFSYNYLTGQTLEKYGTNQCNVTITAYAGFMLPYYFVGGDGFTKQTSDVSFVGDYSAAYSVPYYVFDFSQSHSLINGSYAADDDAYYEFVRANYLDVPETTKEYLQGIALTENWVEGEITYEDIVAIAQYIRKSAKYNMEYNTRLDYEKDVVVSFLDKYKEGVCRHYASAATLLYRTLGIPARYTIGYAGSTVAGEDVEITGKQAHAWVEIYIKGLGWVDIEVTAGGAGGGGGNGGDDFGDGSMGFEVKPIDVKKVYDKTPLYAKSEVEMNEKLRSLSDNGYYWDVTVAGSQTEYGIGESTVTEFVLYNKKGETLYEYRDGTVIENSKGFTVTFKPGKIRVMHKPIPIYLYEKDKPYDGTPLGYEPDDYYYRTSELPKGCSRIILELKGEITDVGVFDTDLLLDLDFKALDANDNDITATIKENYELDFIGTGLTVTKREITVSSGTKQKKYDGKALVCEDAWVSFGSLADGDKIVVTKATSVIDVGEEENEIVVEIMRNGVDVTSNYKINYVYGTLTIYD